jgi:aspartate racemase
MKTIGLLGGMSWESTALYYRLINEETKRIRGGLHSAPVVMLSVDFHEIEKFQEQGDWDAAAALLADKARVIESAGADLLLICTNTMHKVAGTVSAAIGIPLLHIADALEQSGLSVLVPDAMDRALVHRVIYEELCMGRVNTESRREFLRIIEALHDSGAEAVIEGCTEIALLVGQEHTAVPLFDTTRIHASQAVTEALK